MAILVVLAFVAGWYFFGRKPTVVYDEYVPTRSSISDTLELSGKVRAERSASLKFLAGGLVTYLGPKTGDTVKKWQILASVDTRQLQKSMEQKLNLYSIQRGTFEQTADDNNNSVPAGDLANTLKRLLEKNQYQLDNTVKDVEYQDLYLKLSKLVSPLDGVLVQSPITTANVQVSAADAWIVVDPTSLYLSADLDETDLKKVSVGQKVNITLDAYPDLKIVSNITYIAYSPKETTTGTTYEVKISLSQEQTPLRMGLNGTAGVVMTEKDNVLTLPSSAITNVAGKPTVLVKNGSKYTEKSIQTGIEYGGTVEILGGINEGEHVYSKK
jgi:HlyD family secretion protein